MKVKQLLFIFFAALSITLGVKAQTIYEYDISDPTTTGYNGPIIGQGPSIISFNSNFSFSAGIIGGSWGTDRDVRSLGIEHNYTSDIYVPFPIIRYYIQGNGAVIKGVRNGSAPYPYITVRDTLRGVLIPDTLYNVTIGGVTKNYPVIEIADSAFINLLNPFFYTDRKEDFTFSLLTTYRSSDPPVKRSPLQRIGKRAFYNSDFTDHRLTFLKSGDLVGQSTNSYFTGKSFYGYDVQTMSTTPAFDRERLRSPYALSNLKEIGEAAYAQSNLRFWNARYYKSQRGLPKSNSSSYVWTWWAEIQLPATIEKIGDYAFASVGRKNAYPGMSSNPFHATTFDVWIGADAGMPAPSGAFSAVPDTITAARTVIGKYAFANQIPNDSIFISSVYLGANVALVDTGAFMGVLHTVQIDGSGVLQDGTTPAVVPLTIKRNAFRGGQFASLKLPARITNIGEGAFADNKSLTSVTSEAITGAGLSPSSVQIDNSAFSNTPAMQYMTFDHFANVTGDLRRTHDGQTYSQTAMIPSDNWYSSYWYTYGGGAFANMPMNALIYLPSTATLPETYANAVDSIDNINFVQSGACNHYVLFDNVTIPTAKNSGATITGWNRASSGVAPVHAIPATFTAATAAYDRKFAGESCKSLCLTYDATLPAGMTAYGLTKRFEGASSTDRWLRFTSLPTGSTLSAKTPYLVRISDGSTTPKEFPMDMGVSVAANLTEQYYEQASGEDSEIKFLGTVKPITNSTASYLKLYNLSNDVWYPIQTTNTAGYLRSTRAAVRSVSGTFPARAFIISLEDNITGLSEIQQELSTGKVDIYDLGGRYVGNDWDKLSEGVYIISGKKVYKYNNK